MFTKKFWLKDERKETLIFLFVSFVAWRIWIQAFLWLGWLTFPLRDRFIGGGLKHVFDHPGLWPWANFDGEHYLSIAYRGYGNLEQAFFPFFPFLIKLLSSPFKSNFSSELNLFPFLVSGLIIANISFLVALILFYFLVRLDVDKKKARLSIFFLLVFPTSFFFGSVYTESLFLALILGSFYAARKKKWWLAGILGALASATRIVGVFLLPALLWEWWEQQKIKSQKLKVKSLFNLLPIFLVLSGLLWYMRYLSINYQDPLMFLHVQPAFGAERSVDKIILLYQVFWRYLKMIATTKVDPLYFTVWLELFTALGFLGLLIIAYLKKIRLSYLIFAALAYLVPTLTGTFSSMPRYVLILFPGFITLSLIKNRFFRWLLIALSCLLLAISTIFFTRGYWVG